MPQGAQDATQLSPIRGQKAVRACTEPPKVGVALRVSKDRRPAASTGAGRAPMFNRPIGAAMAGDDQREAGVEIGVQLDKGLFLRGGTNGVFEGRKAMEVEGVSDRRHKGIKASFLSGVKRRFLGPQGRGARTVCTTVQKSARGREAELAKGGVGAVRVEEGLLGGPPAFGHSNEAAAGGGGSV